MGWTPGQPIVSNFHVKPHSIFLAKYHGKPVLFPVFNDILLLKVIIVCTHNTQPSWPTYNYALMLGCMSQFSSKWPPWREAQTVHFFVNISRTTHVKGKSTVCCGLASLKCFIFGHDDEQKGLFRLCEHLLFAYVLLCALWFLIGCALLGWVVRSGWHTLFKPKTEGRFFSVYSSHFMVSMLI